MRYVFFMLMFLPFVGIGQEQCKNFKSSDNDLIWQKVYKTDLSQEDLKTYFIRGGFFENLKEREFELTGDLKTFDIDYKEHGGSGASTPIYIRDSYFSAFAVIVMKEGRYRVTLRRIKHIDKSGNHTYLKMNALKKGSAFKDLFKGLASEILNSSFRAQFKVKKLDDEW